MCGAALGGFFAAKILKRNKRSDVSFAVLEVIIALFSFLVAWLLSKWIISLRSPSLIYTALFFISGLLVGLEFPIASLLLLQYKGGVGHVTGSLYCADLLGGWAAGMVGGVLLLPLLGLFDTCIVLVMLKFSSFLLFLVAARG